MVNIQKNLPPKNEEGCRRLLIFLVEFQQDCANEEMVPHQNITWSLKCPLTSQPILLQKIVDDQKENARLEEEIKKLKAHIEKSKSVTE